MRVDGDLIRQLRILNGYSIQELAEEIDVHYGTLGSWERNKTSDVLGTKLFLLSYILDWPMKDFIVHTDADLPNLFEDLEE